KPGKPVQYEPKYLPASGTTIKVTLEYLKDGKTVTVPGQDWVRDAKTRKSMPYNWVFAGSIFYPNQDDPKQPPIYAANGGDVICVSNFPDAMLDLPVNSPQDDAERLYEAFTERIPPLGEAVTIILEPAAEKK
ncbi:MAG TPA: YdjY domain-containing protein, partial [Gemmataceae bacterium]|nr:YdjY domain-containing protein [Gemmataceae bacterium]